MCSFLTEEGMCKARNAFHNLTPQNWSIKHDYSVMNIIISAHDDQSDFPNQIITANIN